MTSRRILLVLASTLAATPAFADKCEIWKDREIRCSWEHDKQIVGRLEFTNKTGAAVAATLNRWSSVCGLPSKHERQHRVNVPPNGQTEELFQSRQASIDVINVPAKTCTEVFVSCGDAKCSDVLAVKQ